MRSYLAAAYIGAHNMPLAQVRGLVVGGDGRVVPQLAETVAWLAGLVTGLLGPVLATEPRVLLDSDVVLADAGIHVTVALPGPTGDRATVVIEVKGCWHTALRTAMESQLRDRYLAGAGSRHGIYLIGWFLCDQWDRGDYRYRGTPKWSVEEARAFFDR